MESYIFADMEYVRVPLSPLDACGVSSGLVFGWVIGTPDFDLDHFNAAVSRVIEKWRLLAGTIEVVEPEGPLGAPWSVKVPIGKLYWMYQTHTMTSDITRLRATDLVLPPSPLAAGGSRVLARPPIEYFSKHGTASTMAEYEDRPRALLSTHVTLFANATCVGLTLPKLLFDAHGAGMVVDAINSELNGLPWIVPRLHTENPLIATCERLISDRTALLPSGDLLDRVKQTFRPASLFQSAKVLVQSVLDHYLHGSVPNALFLKPDLAEKIVAGARSEVPGEDLTTSDALVAWFIRSSYLNEPASTKSFRLATLVDVRQSLESTNSNSDDTLALLKYPHSVSVPVCTPLFPVASLASTSVGVLALFLHRTLADALTIPNLVSTIKFMKTSMAGVAQASTGEDLWSLSSFVDAPTNAISFGAARPMVSCWSYNPPLSPPGALSVSPSERHPSSCEFN